MKSKGKGTAAVILAGVLALAGCATTGAGASGGVAKYEAEKAQIINSSHKKADAPPGTERQSFYSGGLAAGGLNKDTTVADVAADWSNIAYVRFTVTVAKAGAYLVKVAYNGDDDKTVLVRTNDGPGTPVSVPRVADGTWNVMHAKVVTVELKAGKNTLDLSGTLGGAGWWNIDDIEVSPAL